MRLLAAAGQILSATTTLRASRKHRRAVIPRSSTDSHQPSASPVPHRAGPASWGGDAAKVTGSPRPPNHFWLPPYLPDEFPRPFFPNGSYRRYISSPASGRIRQSAVSAFGRGEIRSLFPALLPLIAEDFLAHRRKHILAGLELATVPSASCSAVLATLLALRWFALRPYKVGARVITGSCALGRKFQTTCPREPAAFSGV
jgi:hypothetical protein